MRVLDFGADKTPPFLRGTRARGLALLLGHPGELEVQLRAIAAAGEATDLRVLLPLVESAAAAPRRAIAAARRAPSSAR